MLAGMVDRETADSFDFTNSTTIEVHPASFKSTRGYTIVAALCDEISGVSPPWSGGPPAAAATLSTTPQAATTT